MIKYRDDELAISIEDGHSNGTPSSISSAIASRRPLAGPATGCAVY
jgi:hypothetical protein